MLNRAILQRRIRCGADARLNSIARNCISDLDFLTIVS